MVRDHLDTKALGSYSGDSPRGDSGARGSENVAPDPLQELDAALAKLAPEEDEDDDPEEDQDTETDEDDAQNKCPVCYLSLEGMGTMSCPAGHAVCLLCGLRVATAARGKHAFKCPSCRNLTEVEKAVVDGVQAHAGGGVAGVRVPTPEENLVQRLGTRQAQIRRICTELDNAGSVLAPVDGNYELARTLSWTLEQHMAALITHWDASGVVDPHHEEFLASLVRFRIETVVVLPNRNEVVLRGVNGGSLALNLSSSCAKLKKHVFDELKGMGVLSSKHRKSNKDFSRDFQVHCHKHLASNRK